MAKTLKRFTPKKSGTDPYHIKGLGFLFSPLRTPKPPAPAIPDAIPGHSHDHIFAGRLAESRCPRPATPPDAAAREEFPVLQVGGRPSTSPHPGKRRPPTRGTMPSECSSLAGLLRSPTPTPRATDQEEGSALDVAEALWWVAVSVGRQDLGIDISSGPRQAGGFASLSTNSQLLEPLTRLYNHPWECSCHCRQPVSPSQRYNTLIYRRKVMPQPQKGTNVSSSE